MTRKAWLAAVAIGLLGVSSSWAAVAEKVVADEVQDLVWVGDSRPLLLRCRVWIDGQPFRAAFRSASEDYTRRLFVHLDRNGDGWLSEDEVRRMPPPLVHLAAAGSSPANVAFNFQAIDDNGDGKVSLQELAGYHRRFGGGPFQLQFAPPTPAFVTTLNNALFRRLDANADGRLSRAELAAAGSLLQLDKDDDEVISPQELEPQLQTNPQAEQFVRAAAAGSLTRYPQVLVIDGEDAAAQVARRLLFRYGTGGAKRVSRDEIGLPPVLFARLDVNRDGFLDAQELENFTERPADVDIAVRLGHRRPGEPRLEVSLSPGEGKPAATLPGPWGETVLLAAGAKEPMEVQLYRGRPRQVAAARQRIAQRFREADADRRGFLDAVQARRHDFFPALFPLLDRDGDGRLTEKELLAYLDDVQPFQARALSSVAVLHIAASGQGIFEALDADGDRRLSRRELAAAARLLQSWDVDGDGFLGKDEISPLFRGTWFLGPATGRTPGAAGLFSPPGSPLLSLDVTEEGLVWFRKMDANRDGEVSRREFLGSAEDFRRLDADGDGVISLEEAERAESIFRKTTSPR